MSLWFTSDLHLGHANILAYCPGRPFTSIAEHDARLVERWNARVRQGDVVYCIGDFAFGSREKIAAYRAKLNGRVVLVRGNHDRSIAAMRACGFDDVHNSLGLRLSDWEVFLRHIPPSDDTHAGKTYKPEFRDEPSVNVDRWLCGHVHDKWKQRGNCVNVGVDAWGFAPVAWGQLETLFAEGVK